MLGQRNCRTSSSRQVGSAMESLEDRLLHTGSPYLVENLHIDPAGSLPKHLTEFQGQVYFSATDRHGNELWKSDGTEKGTVLVRDLLPGPEGSYPEALIEFKGELYFFANPEAPGPRWLWKSDGTDAGTTQIAELESVESGIEAFEDRLYFIAEDHLWHSDGSDAGTRKVEVAEHIDAERLFVSDNALFISGRDGLQNSVWKISNGGIHQVGPELGGYVVGVTQLHDEIFFAVEDSDVRTRKLVWKLAKGAEAATLFRVFEGTEQIEMVTAPHAVLLRISRPLTAPAELWRMDGTERGTYRIDLGGSGQLGPDWLVPGAGNVFILSGSEMWSSDGTQAGTHRLTTIDGTSTPSNIAILNDEQYLFAAGLWKSDGTEPGTVKIKDIEGPKFFPEIVEVENTLYFNGNGGEGFELWKSDGTTQGTMLVRDIQTGELPPSSFSPPHVEPRNLSVIQDQLYFTHGDSLRVSDGGVDATRKIADVAASEIVQLGDVGVFRVYDPAQLAYVLWTTDGTMEGTRPYFEFDSEYQRALLTNTQLGSALFFFVESNTGRELWKTDGTEAGTSPVVTIIGADSESSLTDNQLQKRWEIVAFENKLFFRVVKDNSQELWVSDGTPENTEVIFDFGPRSANRPAPSIENFSFDFEIVGDRLVFAANTAESGRELWATDGTAAGTVRLTDIVEGKRSSIRHHSPLWVAGNRVFFVGGDGAVGSSAHGTALFVSDGTNAGTHQLTDFEQSMSFAIFEAVEFNNELYFTARLSEEHGLELYRSDGTTAGTRLVKDILPGRQNGAPIGLTVFDGKIYFTARNTVDNRELWESDGTPEGTRMVSDIRAGAEGSELHYLTPTDSHLFFTADDGITGRELWALSKDGFADFDNDGAVAFSDFLILSKNFGKNDVSFEQGDINGDADITFVDFLLLAAQIGQSVN